MSSADKNIKLMWLKWQQIEISSQHHGYSRCTIIMTFYLIIGDIYFLSFGRNIWHSWNRLNRIGRTVEEIIVAVNVQPTFWCINRKYVIKKILLEHNKKPLWSWQSSCSWWTPSLALRTFLLCWNLISSISKEPTCRGDGDVRIQVGHNDQFYQNLKQTMYSCLYCWI